LDRAQTIQILIPAAHNQSRNRGNPEKNARYASVPESFDLIIPLEIKGIVTQCEIVFSWLLVFFVKELPGNYPFSNIN